MKKFKLIISSIFLMIANVNAANYNIDSGNYYYAPNSLTVNIGDTVTWNNVQGYHNVNFDINTITGASFNNPVSFISSPTGMGVIYSHVFTVSGTYEYDCSVGSHAANGMVGTIVVNGAPSNTIYDIVSNSPIHNYLKICLDTTSLDVVFADVNQDLTLFAPSDDAFLALPPGTVTALLMDINLLTDILKHHAVQGTVLSGSLTNNQVVTTLLGTNVTVTINSVGVFIDNAQVTVVDVIADNGVVHIINAVLLPPMDCNSVIDGTALVDSCGTCQQAYLYDFQTNTPTFVDNANILVAGVDYDPATQALIFPNDPTNPLWVSDPALCTNSIYDIVSNSADHTTLKAAVDACGLDVFLSDPGTLTLFAPTDAAFSALPAGTVTALLADIPLLTDILKHHVAGASVMSGMLSNNQVVTTLLGTDVTVTINSIGVFIDNAQVIVADIVADNGVVHVIDAVLLPPTNTIYDIVSNSADHTTLKAAVDACGLDVFLSDPGTLTLFAPTDAAFSALPAGTVTALLADIPLLTDILKHHVAGASVMSGMLSNNQVVTTLLGTDVTVTINSIGVFIDNAQVIVADIVADNGVVHVIDAVLIPTTTDIIDYNNLENIYLYSINILGEKVSSNLKNQIIFNVFKDGSIEKVFNK